MQFGLCRQVDQVQRRWVLVVGSGADTAARLMQHQIEWLTRLQQFAGGFNTAERGDLLAPMGDGAAVQQNLALCEHRAHGARRVRQSAFDKSIQPHNACSVQIVMGMILKNVRFEESGFAESRGLSRDMEYR